MVGVGERVPECSAAGHTAHRSQPGESQKLLTLEVLQQVVIGDGYEAFRRGHNSLPRHFHLRRWRQRRRPPLRG